MLRKFLLSAVFVGLIGVAAPQAADANAANAGVVVFTGVAKVGSPSWIGATGPGLCFPNFVASPGACTFTPLALASGPQAWSLSVPPDPGGVVPCGLVSAPCVDFPRTCNAAGVFNAIPVVPNAPTGPPSNPSVNNCGFAIDGDLFANDVGVGPSCGMSKGTSTDSDGVGPLTGGPSTDTITVTGVGPATAKVGWLTSAGGSLPINGTVEYSAGHEHLVAGYTQARPVAGGNCATVPAQDFVTAGVLATLPA